MNSATNRLYLYAQLTENALASLSRPDDSLDLNHLSIDVVGSTPALPEEREPRVRVLTSLLSA